MRMAPEVALIAELRDGPRVAIKALKYGTVNIAQSALGVPVYGSIQHFNDYF